MKLILAVFLLCITITFAANPMRPGVRGYAAPDARPDEFRVSFWGGLKFDPGRNAPPLSPDLRVEAYPGDGTGYYLVQFDGPVSEYQIEALVDLGVGFVGFHSRRLAFVRMDRTRAEAGNRPRRPETGTCRAGRRNGRRGDG